MTNSPATRKRNLFPRPTTSPWLPWLRSLAQLHPYAQRLNPSPNRHRLHVTNRPPNPQRKTLVRLLRRLAQETHESRNQRCGRIANVAAEIHVDIQRPCRVSGEHVIRGVGY